MLAVKGHNDLRRGMRVGAQLPAHWVEIEHPDRGIDSDGGITGVLRQGLAAGGARFTRLEGCIATDGVVYFTSTDGGDLAAGDRKSVVSGKSVSVRVDLGGRRLLKKQTVTQTMIYTIEDCTDKSVNAHIDQYELQSLYIVTNKN